MPLTASPSALRYGYTPEGEKIAPPKPPKMHPDAEKRYRAAYAEGKGYGMTDPDGVWRILEEGEWVPSHYRAYDKVHGWLPEKWGHSTCCPIIAKIHGHKIAIAALVDNDFKKVNYPPKVNFDDREDFVPTPTTDGYDLQKVKAFIAANRDLITSYESFDLHTFVLHTDNPKELDERVHANNQDPEKSIGVDVIAGYDNRGTVFSNKRCRFQIYPVLQFIKYALPLIGYPNTVQLYWH